jgi:hypothetical protein
MPRVAVFCGSRAGVILTWAQLDLHARPVGPLDVGTPLDGLVVPWLEPA